MLNLSIRFNKVEKLIQFIINDKNIWDIVKTIYFQNIFFFKYNIWKLTNININYLYLKYNINNFKLSILIIMKFYMLLYNFKFSKKYKL